MKERKERKKERKRFTTRAPLYARIYQKQCRAQKTEEGFSRIQYAKRECVLRVDDVFFSLNKTKIEAFFLLFRKQQNTLFVPAVKKQKPLTTFVLFAHREEEEVKKKSRRRAQTHAVYTRCILSLFLLPGGRQNGKRKKKST